MSSEQRLRARLDEPHAECVKTLKQERDIERADAERIVVREGLESLGYTEKPTEAHEMLLFYTERIGLVLGFVGLIMIGYGVFGPRLWSVIGFGITLGGFLLVAVQTFLGAYLPGEGVSVDAER